MNKYIYAILIISLFYFQSCEKKRLKEGVTDIPLIEQEGIPNNILHFTDTSSKLLITFRVFDKDKDIGKSYSDTGIFLNEYRSDTLYREHKLGMPQLAPEVIDDTYLEAIVTMDLPGVVFTPRNDSIHIRSRKDTFYIEYWVKDEAGNQSNILTTNNFYIEP